MTLGFYFNAERCIGCRTCQTACKDRHDLMTAGPRTRRVTSFECGVYPTPELFHLSVSCNHCENPACVEACPTGATFKGEDGIVVHNDEACIRCKSCVSACPFEAPQYDEINDLIVKCDSCKALREAGMNPVCVDACLTRALDFGDLDELREKYAAFGELQTVVPALGEDITGPNLLIMAGEVATRNDFIEVVL